MLKGVCAVALLLAAPSNGLVVAGGRMCRPHRSPRSRLLLLGAATTPPLQPEDVKPPPASGLTVPLPRFSWRTVAFIALNPAALLPLPIAGWFLGVNLLGSAFSVSRLVCYLGLLWALPLFALSLLPLERIPALSALREVSQASETICLYALGSRLAPLRASLAAVLLSTSAALCEELAFRGLLQTLAATTLAALGVPARACVARGRQTSLADREDSGGSGEEDDSDADDDDDDESEADADSDGDVEPAKAARSTSDGGDDDDSDDDSDVEAEDDESDNDDDK